MAAGRGESVVSYLKDPRTGIKDGGFPGHVKAEHRSANDEDQIEILQGLGQVLRNRRKKSSEQPVILGKACTAAVWSLEDRSVEAFREFNRERIRVLPVHFSPNHERRIFARSQSIRQFSNAAL